MPVNPDHVQDFNPEEVPTVGNLLRELDNVKGLEEGKEANWEHTSLKKYVDMFEKHINAVIKDNTRAKKGELNRFLPVVFVVADHCLTAAVKTEALDF